MKKMLVVFTLCFVCFVSYSQTLTQPPECYTVVQEEVLPDHIVARILKVEERGDSGFVLQTFSRRTTANGEVVERPGFYRSLGTQLTEAVIYTIGEQRFLSYADNEKKFHRIQF